MPEEIDDLNLTAYAIGELDGAEHAAERAKLQTRLAGDDFLRRQVEEIRTTAQWVSSELAAENTPGLSELQHAAIERRLERSAERDDPILPLRPVRRNWAFWGSLAASIAIVCTVMATVLPKLYHIGYVNHGAGGSALNPATAPAPFIVEDPSVASRDLSSPAVAEDPYSSSDGGFPNAAPPVERGENPFVQVADSPVSGVPIVSAYPDDAGELAPIARSLDKHQLPPPDALRIDGIINALAYHYAAPTRDEPVSAARVELASCPWNASHKLLRVGLRTADAPPATRPGTSPSAADGVAGLKVQIEFNPAMAGAYRLIGYETGASAGHFRDGSMAPRAAGLVAAGRSATVVYEVIPPGIVGPAASLRPLKYQKLTPVAQVSREMATVSIHYREPATAAVRVREISVSDDGGTFAAASDDFRAAAAAAAFGLALRNSPYAGNASFDMVIELLNSIPGGDSDAGRATLMELAKKAKDIAR